MKADKQRQTEQPETSFSFSKYKLVSVLSIACIACVIFALILSSKSGGETIDQRAREDAKEEAARSALAAEREKNVGGDVEKILRNTTGGSMVDEAAVNLVNTVQQFSSVLVLIIVLAFVIGILANLSNKFK